MSESNDQWIEDLLYFEGPLLALFRDTKTGQQSLHYWCGQVGVFNVWSRFDVTQEQLDAYRAQKMSLFEIATTTTNCSYYYLDENLSVVRVVDDGVPADFMPPKSSFYDPDLAPQHYYLDYPNK